MERLGAGTEDITLSERMATYICGERFENIDPRTTQRAKQVLVYHLGLAFRAIQKNNDLAKQSLQIAHTLSENCGSSTILGHSQKATIVDAAFVNCTLMRALGLDDVIFPAGIHPGLMVLPVALGVGEKERSSGQEIISAIIAAYEILGKFGKFTWCMQTPRRPTMPFGPFGGVAAASKLLKLDHAQTTVALAYAAHTAMGLAESDRGPVSHYYSLVCRNAIMGAYAAKAGAWGSPTVLDGKFGFIETFLGGDAIDEDELIASLGADYAILGSCEKRYPGTALNHIAIELVRDLVEKDSIRADSVDTIIFSIPEERRNFAAGHEFGPYADAGAAGSSFPFQCAILLIDGVQDAARYEEFENEEILSFIKRMSLDFVSGKSIRYTRVAVHLKTGETIVREGDDFKHSPGQSRRVLEKDAEGVLPQQKIDRLIELADNLETVRDIGALMEAVVP